MTSLTGQITKDPSPTIVRKKIIETLPGATFVYDRHQTTDDYHHESEDTALARVAAILVAYPHGVVTEERSERRFGGKRPNVRVITVTITKAPT